MFWRPKGWPAIRAEWERYWIGHIERIRPVADSFEDGAGAVIKALREGPEVVAIDGYGNILFDDSTQLPKDAGKVVFIPLLKEEVEPLT